VHRPLAPAHFLFVIRIRRLITFYFFIFSSALFEIPLRFPCVRVSFSLSPFLVFKEHATAPTDLVLAPSCTRLRVRFFSVPASIRLFSFFFFFGESYVLFAPLHSLAPRVGRFPTTGGCVVMDCLGNFSLWIFLEPPFPTFSWRDAQTTIHRVANSFV